MATIIAQGGLKNMDWTLAFIHELCLALWVGGLFALDAEAPIRLKTPGVTPEQATAIGSRVFRLFRYVQVLLGFESRFVV
jgi:putative copper export protein